MRRPEEHTARGDSGNLVRRERILRSELIRAILLEDSRLHFVVQCESVCPSEGGTLSHGRKLVRSRMGRQAAEGGSLYFPPLRLSPCDYVNSCWDVQDRGRPPEPGSARVGGRSEWTTLLCFTLRVVSTDPPGCVCVCVCTAVRPQALTDRRAPPTAGG